MFTKFERDLRSAICDLLDTPAYQAKWTNPATPYGRLEHFRKPLTDALRDDGAKPKRARRAANYIVAQVVAYVHGEQIPECNDARLTLDIMRLKTALEYLDASFGLLHPTAQHFVKLALFSQLELVNDAPYRAALRGKLQDSRAGEQLYGSSFHCLQELVKHSNAALQAHPLPVGVKAGPNPNRSVEALFGETIDEWVAATGNWPGSTVAHGGKPEKTDESDALPDIEKTEGKLKSALYETIIQMVTELAPTKRVLVKALSPRRFRSTHSLHKQVAAHLPPRDQPPRRRKKR